MTLPSRSCESPFCVKKLKFSESSHIATNSAWHTSSVQEISFRWMVGNIPSKWKLSGFTVRSNWLQSHTISSIVHCLLCETTQNCFKMVKKNTINVNTVRKPWFLLSYQSDFNFQMCFSKEWRKTENICQDLQGLF